MAAGQVADICLHEAEILPLRWVDYTLNFIEVALVAGREVIEPHHFLVELKQCFKQVATNKTAHTCDEPRVLLRL
jgi:hypothetical protein